jgi:hypothetical protein
MSNGNETGCGCGGVLFIVIIVVLLVVFFRPQSFRTPAQVPASVTIRGSLVGIGNVVQVRNTSEKSLTGVVVTGRNSASNQTVTYRIGSIEPGKTVEVGWREWNWIVVPGETITISADGYLSIVFSSEQLGIR